MLFFILYSLIMILNAASNPDTDRTKATTSRSKKRRYSNMAKTDTVHIKNSNSNMPIFEENVLTSTFSNNCQVSNEMDIYLPVASGNEIAQQDHSLESIDNIVPLDDLAPLNSYLVFPCYSNSSQSKQNSTLADNFMKTKYIAREHIIHKNQAVEISSQNDNLKNRLPLASTPNNISNKNVKSLSKKKQIVNENSNNELDWLNDLFAEKLADIQETKKHPKITIPNVDIDLDLLNSKGKLEESIELNKIMAIMKKSLIAIDLSHKFLEEEIRESLNSEKISKYFIYNYFFDDDLKIRCEYLFLLLNIPEINIITVMYESLGNKPTLDIPDELLDEFVKYLLSLINEYKKAIECYINKFKFKRNITIVEFMIFFGNGLFEHIKKFRTINEKVLNELFNFSSNLSKSACSSATNFNEKKPSVSQANVKDKLARKKTKHIISSDEEESINLAALLTFYKNINDYSITETNSLKYVTNNFFISAVFLNNNWLKCLSNEKTNFKDINLNDINNVKNKVINYYKGQKFDMLHKNIYEFIKLLFKKYFKIANEEKITVFKCQQHQIFFEKPIRYQTTFTHYINYIFGRYNEILLQYYIEMYSE